MDNSNRYQEHTWSHAESRDDPDDAGHTDITHPGHSCLQRGQSVVERVSKSANGVLSGPALGFHHYPALQLRG